MSYSTSRESPTITTLIQYMKKPLSSVAARIAPQNQ